MYLHVHTCTVLASYPGPLEKSEGLGMRLVQCMLELPCSKAISTHFLIAYKLCKSDRKGLVMTSVLGGWRRDSKRVRVCH